MNDYEDNYPFQDIVNGDEMMLSMRSGPFESKDSNESKTDRYQEVLDTAKLYQKFLDSLDLDYPDEEEVSKPVPAKTTEPAKPDSAGMKALQDSGQMSDQQVSIIRSLLDALEEKGIGTSDLASTAGLAPNNSDQGKKVIIEIEEETSDAPVHHEVLEQFVLVNSSVDRIFERLTAWSGPERNNDVAHGVINSLSYEDLCELIDIDVYPDSEAGEFLLELLESYKMLMDQVVWKYPEGSGFPMPEEFHKLKKTYYDSTVTSREREFLENIAFEFTGDEDIAGVDRIARQLFASLQKIFKRGAGRS